MSGLLSRLWRVLLCRMDVHEWQPRRWQGKPGTQHQGQGFTDFVCADCAAVTSAVRPARRSLNRL